ncbi:major facilitator superfamily-domain-containing protein [Poronia punctata]|nr:major facilitator superfamily-domain-containing protein [Poronia punctata]
MSRNQTLFTSPFWDDSPLTDIPLAEFHKEVDESNGSSSNQRGSAASPAKEVNEAHLPPPVSRWSDDSDGDVTGCVFPAPSTMLPRLSSQRQVRPEVRWDSPDLLPERPPPVAPHTHIVFRHSGHPGHGRRQGRPRRQLPKDPAPSRCWFKRTRGIHPAVPWIDTVVSRDIQCAITICLAHFCAHAGFGQALPMLKLAAMRFDIANVTSLNWAVAGYTMILGVYMLIGRRLGEIFGNKHVFILGLLSSVFWAIVAGASYYAPTHKLFIASRTFQGLGVAMTLPTGLAMVTRLNRTPAQLHRISLTYAAMAPLGLIIGALGSSVAALAWWSWSYWVFAIALTILAGLGCYTIPPGPSKTLPSGLSALILELDLPGMMCGVAAWVLFGFAWIQADTVGWEEPYIWMALIMSIASTVLFVMVERFYAKKPLLPREAQSWEVSIILAAVALGWSSFGAAIFYGWQFLQSLKRVSPLEATGYYVPLMVVGCAAVVTHPWITMRLGVHAVVYATCLSTILGCILLATRPLSQSFWPQQFTSMLFIGWSAYTIVPLAAALISQGREIGPDLAAMLVDTAVFYGIALGLGIAGTAESRSMDGSLTLADRFKGYRAAYWTSVGMAGLQLLVYLSLLFATRRKKRETPILEDGAIELQDR